MPGGGSMEKTDESYQVVEVSDATDDSLPLSALKNVEAKKTEGKENAKTEGPSALEKSPKRKKKKSEKATHFMEMEYHGTWWTGIEHEDFRTKTYDISQHKFMEDLDSETEVFVDALTEEGFEFSF
eukprot:3628414-Amphidinium_carterae.2